MFKLASPDTLYHRKVRVSVPQPEGGVTEEEFTAHFRITGKTRDERMAMSDQAFIEDVLAGWDGVVDAQGKPVPFSDKARDALALLDYVAMGIGTAYGELITGQAEKNSGTLPAAGAAADQTSA